MSFKQTTIANKHHTVLKMKTEKAQSDLKIRLANEEKVSVSIPSLYDQFLGKNLPLTIGQQRIVVPVDGKYYRIPKSFAAILKEVLMQIDKEHKRSQGRHGGFQGDVSPTGEVPGLT